MDDLRQKCEEKGKFGALGKRHKRGGMRQKSVKMCVFGTEYNRMCVFGTECHQMFTIEMLFMFIASITGFVFDTWVRICLTMSNPDIRDNALRLILGFQLLLAR